MTPVDMLHHHSEATESIPGDCFRACVASLFDLPCESVPHFVAHPKGEHYWLNAVNEWLLEKRLFYTIFRDEAIYPPKGGALVIGSGKSPRGDFSHAVIYRYDYGPLELIHDPHPSRAGIDGNPRSFGVFASLFLPNAQPSPGPQASGA